MNIQCMNIRNKNYKFHIKESRNISKLNGCVFNNYNAKYCAGFIINTIRYKE